jgi:hypothetical protein
MDSEETWPSQYTLALLLVVTRRLAEEEVSEHRRDLGYFDAQRCAGCGSELQSFHSHIVVRPLTSKSNRLAFFLTPKSKPTSPF